MKKRTAKMPTTQVPQVKKKKVNPLPNKTIHFDGTPFVGRHTTG